MNRATRSTRPLRPGAPALAPAVSLSRALPVTVSLAPRFTVSLALLATLSLALLATLSLALLAATPARAEVLALTGGTVHTVSGPVIENGTVLVDGTRITAVAAGLAAPAGAHIVDCTGKQVYPGFVHANTVLGLQEISTIQGADDTQESGNVNPNQRAEVMYNPDSDFLPVTRLNGVTTVLTIPGGGAIRGTSALMHLDGWTQEDITVRAPAGLHVQWPNMTPVHAFFILASDEDQAKSRDQAIQAIGDAFDDARAYWKARDAEGTAGVPKHDDDVRWDGMRKALKGEIPVIFHCDALSQIRAVLRFCDKQGLTNIVLLGGADSWRVADELKRRDIAVIVGGVLALPARGYEPYDDAFTLPAKLSKAGVRFCIADNGGSFAAANARNLPHHAAMAVAFGLDRDEALKSVTLYPAQILGAGDKIGSIDVGKVADLQITDGDPLLVATHCEQVVLNGRLEPMESRQTRLFHKYDARPRGPKARKK